MRWGGVRVFGESSVSQPETPAVGLDSVSAVSRAPTPSTSERIGEAQPVVRVVGALGADEPLVALGAEGRPQHVLGVVHLAGEVEQGAAGGVRPQGGGE